MMRRALKRCSDHNVGNRLEEQGLGRELSSSMQGQRPTPGLDKMEDGRKERSRQVSDAFRSYNEHDLAVDGLFERGGKGEGAFKDDF